jgi:hypothetical protein
MLAVETDEWRRRFEVSGSVIQATGGAYHWLTNGAKNVVFYAKSSLQGWVPVSRAGRCEWQGVGYLQRSAKLDRIGCKPLPPQIVVSVASRRRAFRRQDAVLPESVTQIHPRKLLKEHRELGFVWSTRQERGNDGHATVQELRQQRPHLLIVPGTDDAFSNEHGR